MYEQLVGIKTVHPSINTSLVIFTLKLGTVVLVHRTQRPAAQLPVGHITTDSRGIRRLGSFVIPSPTDHLCHGGLRSGTVALQGVCRAVSSNWDEVDMVSIVHGSDTVVV